MVMNCDNDDDDDNDHAGAGEDTGGSLGALLGHLVNFCKVS